MILGDQLRMLCPAMCRNVKDACQPLTSSTTTVTETTTTKTVTTATTNTIAIPEKSSSQSFMASTAGFATVGSAVFLLLLVLLFVYMKRDQKQLKTQFALVMDNPLYDEGSQLESDGYLEVGSSASASAVAMREFFDLVDTDASKTVTKQELMNYCRANPKNKELLGVRKGFGWNACFTAMDVSKTGEVTYEEFSRAVIKADVEGGGASVVRWKAMRDVFAEIDEDRSGTMSKSELATYCKAHKDFTKRLGLKKGFGLTAFFNAIDFVGNKKRKDHPVDGPQVTFDEFQQALEQLDKEAQAESEREDALWELFEELDDNNDGNVTKAELRTGIKQNKDLKARLNLGKGFGWADCFEKMDQSGDGKVTFDEFKTAIDNADGESKKAIELGRLLYEIFSEIDDDGSDTVTLDELKEYMAANKDFKKRLGVKKGFTFANVFESMDVDGDGEVSFKEFKAAVVKADTESEANMQRSNELRKLFKAMDTDKSGGLSKNELKQYCDKHSEMKDRLSMGKPSFSLDTIFDEMSPGEDGNVSFKEFKRAVMKADSMSVEDTSVVGAIREIFSAIDKDGDGNVTKPELVEYCKANPDMKKRLGVKKGFTYADLFDEMKAAKDGAVTFQQFKKALYQADALTAREKKRMAEVRKIFKEVDADGDGQLTKQELKTYCMSNPDLKSRLGVKKGFGWNACFGEMDKAGSGALTVKAFRLALDAADAKAEFLEGDIDKAMRKVSVDADTAATGFQGL
jgi:Ca2+-binding EF-hand superfamily protein